MHMVQNTQEHREKIVFHQIYPTTTQVPTGNLYYQFLCIVLDEILFRDLRGCEAQ